MYKDYLIKLKTNKEKLLSDFDFQKSVLLDLIKIGFVYVKEHYTVGESKFPNMMLQMSLLKANSILNLAEGSKINKLSGIDDSIIDIQSQSSVFRSLFENYCFFNHLYIGEWSQEEFLLLENIWKITSLNQRFTMLENSPILKKPENEEKINNEKEYISKLTKEIRSTSIYSKNKGFIENCIKINKWQITFEKGKAKHISWKNMFKKSSKNRSNNNKTYQALSLDSHPSYFAVFQFGDLYKTRYDLTRRTTMMFQTIELVCNYLFDFQKLIPKEVEIASENKHLIEFFGKFFVEKI